MAETGPDGRHGGAGANGADRLRLLVVEDDPGHARLTVEALKASEAVGPVFVVRDGLEALEFLREDAAGDPRSLPDAVFLDLRLPGLSGYAVLAELKRDRVLARMPVVIVSGSQDGSDIGRSYALDADYYVIKPVGFHDFVAALGDVVADLGAREPGAVTDG